MKRAVVIAMLLSMNTWGAVACQKCQPSEVVALGDCETDNLTATDQQLDRLDVSLACLDGTLLELLQTHDGLDGDFYSVQGNEELGSFQLALVTVAEQSAFDVLDKAGCLIYSDSPLVDWESRQLVLAAFTGLPSIREEMSIDYFTDAGDNLHLTIHFSYTPDEQGNRVGSLNAAGSVEKTMSNTCLRLVRDCP